MPRDFLAPYKFELVDSTKEELKKCLENLKKQVYVNKKDLTRLRCESTNIKEDSTIGELVYGYVEYGKYGTERPVLDDLGQKTKEIEENESPMDKYFYVFNFQDSSRGYLILQRIGNVGVRTILSNAINSHGNKIKISPMVLGIKELLENDIVDITFEIPQIPRLSEEKLQNIIDKEEVKTTVISLKTARNQSFKGNKIKQFISKISDKIQENAGNYDLANVGYIIDEKETLKITVKVGKSRRTINISSGKVRSWIEVEKGEVISTKAMGLLRDIRSNGENNV